MRGSDVLEFIMVDLSANVHPRAGAYSQILFDQAELSARLALLLAGVDVQDPSQMGCASFSRSDRFGFSDRAWNTWMGIVHTGQLEDPDPVFGHFLHRPFALAVEAHPPGVDLLRLTLRPGAQMVRLQSWVSGKLTADESLNCDLGRFQDPETVCREALELFAHDHRFASFFWSRPVSA